MSFKFQNCGVDDIDLICMPNSNESIVMGRKKLYIYSIYIDIFIKRQTDIYVVMSIIFILRLP